MKRVPAGRALSWVANSLGLLRRQFFRLLLIGLLLQFLTGFSQAGPIGLLFVLAIPAMTAGVLQAMHIVDRGEVPAVMTLFAAFQSGQRLFRLFMFGFVMLAAGFLVAGGALSGALESMDPGTLAALEKGDLQALQSADPALLQRLAIAVLAGLVFSVVLAFFTIPLLWFGNLALGRALVNGFAAIISNLPALLVLVLLMVMLAMPVGLLVSMLFSGAAGSAVVSLLMLAVVVCYQLLFLGAQYMAFKDIFGIENGHKAGGTESDGQLLA